MTISGSLHHSVHMEKHQRSPKELQVSKEDAHYLQFFHPCRSLLELWTKRFRLGKTSSLKALIKEAESELDVTSIMLAREQVLVISIFKKTFLGGKHCNVRLLVC